MVTRITNSMLTGKLMSNLYTNLGSLSKLQNQLASGRKNAHISDDPSALIYGQAARNKLARLSHYQGSVSTAQKWNVQTESGVMELQKVVGGIYEELVNAGGAKTIADRQNIGMMVSQMRSHYLDTLNSSFGDRFVFGGYNTPGDYVAGNAPTIKPFTLDGNVSPSRPEGNLLFNGFNVSQFDGMPVAMLDVTTVTVNVGGVPTRINVSDIYDMDAADPVRALAVTELENVWNTHIANMMEADGVTPLYPAGLDGGTVPPAPGSVFAAFGENADRFATPPIGPDAGGEMTTDKILFLHKMMNDVIEFDVGPGIKMPVTLNGIDILFFGTQDRPDGNQIVRNMYELLNEAHGAINGDIMDPNSGLEYDVDELSPIIKLLQDGQNHLLVKTAEIGGRDRRLELLESRYLDDEINYDQMRSDAEDADIAEVIMNMRLAETVYQAALSAGARVIQPTLMDFLR